MLTTTQSTRTEQPLQGVLASKTEFKEDSSLPEKSSFSKLFSSMRLEATSEAAVSVSPAESTALADEDSAELMAFPQLNESEDVALSIMQQLPALNVASNYADSNLSAELSLNDSDASNLTVLDAAPLVDGSDLEILDAAPLVGGSDLEILDAAPLVDGSDLEILDAAPLVDGSDLTVLDAAPLVDGSDLTVLDAAPLVDGSDLTVLGTAPLVDVSELKKLDIVGVDSNLSAELNLNNSEAPLVVVEGVDSPLVTPVIDATELKADSEALMSASVVSNQNEQVVEDLNGLIAQSVALNQSPTVIANSSNGQVNSAVSNAASNSVTSWGAQSQAAVGGDAQAGTQQNQAFTQSGQSGQNPQSQAGQQQTMMFAQFVKEGKAQALEQQAAVRAVDESTLKSEVKDLLGGAEIASTDRRGNLPLSMQSIQQPLKHPQWSQALGQRVVFMANNSIQQAQITLNPEKLGQIQVTLQLDKDQKMNVSMTAQNGTTRESMENALPKLREMLEQSGITLGSMDVSDQKQFSDSDSGKPTSKGVAPNNAIEKEEAIIESTLSTVKTTDNIVDYYA